MKIEGCYCGWAKRIYEVGAAICIIEGLIIAVALVPAFIKTDWVSILVLAFFLCGSVSVGKSFIRARLKQNGGVIVDTEGILIERLSRKIPFHEIGDVRFSKSGSTFLITDCNDAVLAEVAEGMTNYMHIFEALQSKVKATRAEPVAGGDATR